jgi:predicted GIY-YIG superfamily endonuclease
MKFFYVYILKLANGDYYIGRSNDLKRRLNEHDTGQDRTTSMYLPCKLVTYLAFEKKDLAIKFELYLKSGSGFAFRKRHLV